MRPSRVIAAVLLAVTAPAVARTLGFNTTTALQGCLPINNTIYRLTRGAADVTVRLAASSEAPGIRIKLLYSDDNGITTALFKLEPGAVVPLHEHTALEQTYVIEGTLQDHEGVAGPGQFVWRPAGNQHEAVAPNGAVLLGFFLKPNRFAYGEKFFTEEKK